MKKPLKRTIVSLSSIFIIMLSTTKISESCGFSFRAEDYRVAFFSPSVLSDNAFYPFFYTSEIINSVDASFEIDKERNLKLWQKELGISVELMDIDKVLYLADNDEVVNAYNEKVLDEKYAGNTFIKAILKPENQPILEYFILTKQNEFINFANDNPWDFYDDETVKYNDVAEREAVIEKITERLKNVKSDFLKQRYAYLQLVNYRYHLPRKGVEIFEEYFDLNNNDIITAWAIFHTAACVSDEIKANYYLSLAFDKCDSKKARCYFGFRESLTNETLSLAKNNAEKATIQAISIVNNPARQLAAIKKIYALDPNNRNLEGLIFREINKIEDWLLTSKVTGMPKSIEEENNDFFGYGEYGYVNDEWKRLTNNEPQLYRNEVNWQSNYFNIKNYEKDLTYAREFRNFLEQLAVSTFRNKDFLNFAISHLYFMDGNPKMALAYNNKVSGKSVKTKTQQAINNILLLPLTEDITTISTKNNLYQSLQFIQNHLTEINKPLRTVSQLHLYLSKMYFRKGDVVTASFFHQKSSFTAKQEWHGSIYYASIAFFDRYGTTADIEKAIQLLNKKQTTDFEKYLLQKYTVQELSYENGVEDWSVFEGWNIEEAQEQEQQLKLALTELQGTIAFRQDNLKAALSYFEKLPKDYWQTTYAFTNYLSNSPFAKGFIWDEDRSNSGIDDANKKALNKAEVIKKLIALKTKAEKTKDAQTYFELGNAYHNFTYHGNSWMMFSYGKYGGELNNKTGYSYSFYPNSDKYFEVYYNKSRAKMYYEKAVNFAKKDKEIKAKADWMIAVCDGNKKEQQNDYSNTDDDDKLLKNWIKEYKDTETYELIAISCSFSEE